ncbi:MAG: signal peptidase I [Steroidobacteraceae bacterium]
MHGFQRFKALLHDNRSTLLFIALMLMFRSSYADWMLVPTGSMNPTIVEGDYIFADKRAYGWRIPFTTTRLTQGNDPQRGEIAIFYSPKDGTRLVKRVIGVPGDTIEMRDEVLFINGSQLNYSAREASQEILRSTQLTQPEFVTEQLGDTAHAVMLLPTAFARRNFAPVTIPADQYLMLGDNRDNSEDSRYIGLVPRDRFVGRAHHVLMSFNPEHYYLPRIYRAWQPLI